MSHEGSVDIGAAPPPSPLAGAPRRPTRWLLVGLATLLVGALGATAALSRRPDRLAPSTSVTFQDAAVPALDMAGNPLRLGFDVAVVLVPLDRPAGPGCPSGVQVAVPASWQLDRLSSGELVSDQVAAGRRTLRLRADPEDSFLRATLALPVGQDTPAALPTDQPVDLSLFRVCHGSWQEQDRRRLTGVAG